VSAAHAPLVMEGAASSAPASAPGGDVWHHELLTLATPHPALVPEVLRAALERTCAQLGHALTGQVLHRFEPQGLSLVLFGPRLRLVLHTWPERDVATLDVLCGGEAEALVEAVRAVLGALVRERHRHARAAAGGPVR
jgi:S-adenosylmethionine decarboxylase